MTKQFRSSTFLHSEPTLCGNPNNRVPVLFDPKPCARELVPLSAGAAPQEACLAELAAGAYFSTSAGVVMKYSAAHRATSLGLPGVSYTAHAFFLYFVYIIMASSYARGDFAVGLPSPSSSASLDSDNDTDLDSIEAEIQSHGYRLPLPDQRFLQQPPHQYAPPERYSSLRPDIEYDYGDVRPHSSQQYRLSGEGKQCFDHFWTEFHDKGRQRRAQAPGIRIDTERSVDDIMNERHYQGKRYDVRAYEFPRHRQPLVNLARNGRHSGSRASNHSAWSYDDSDPSSPTLSQVLSAPRPRRWLMILCTWIIFLTVYWRQYGAEVWYEHKTLSSVIQDKIQSNLGYFGTNILPEFVGMTHLKTLDEALVPRSGNKRRLIIVGDVHGCVDECGFLPSLQLH